MFKQMQTLYTELAEYYAFDKQKYTMEEFFGDIKTFKDMFLVNFWWILILEIGCLIWKWRRFLVYAFGKVKSKKNAACVFRMFFVASIAK